MIRACLSGDEACTGIVPCDACAKAITKRVLPKAMVAGGFNGNADIAMRFFQAYLAAMAELQEQAPHEMAQAMRPEPEPAPHPDEEPENEEEVEEEENAALTEDEVSQMGQVEDVVEEDAPQLPGNVARDLARKARALKKKRALKKQKEKEGTHG